MNKLVQWVLAIGVLGILIAILILLAPLILLASLNTISEQGNLGWYIPHNFWTYLSSYGLMLTLRGFSKSGE